MTEPSFRIHTSNRLEVLVERLAAELAAAPLPPLEREMVVVQSQGMYRWVTLELARRLGIAAHLAMPFPRTFCHHLADRLLPGAPEAAAGADPGRRPASLFSRELLTWRLFGLLGRGEGSIFADPRFRRAVAGPAAYLDDDPDQRKRHQLAARLAALLDDYQLYRPERMLEWQAAAPDGDGDPADPAVWQALLWRRLLADVAAAGAGEEHLASRFTGLIELLHRASEPPEGLPRRVSVFGVSTLPPIFVRLLVALSRFVPVSVYFVSPTYHFWGDLRSEREAERIRRRLQRPEPTPVADPDDELHLEAGNPLLAALGRQGRDFFNLLQESDEEGAAWHQLDFPVPEPDTVLHAVQADVLHLVDRGPGGDAPPLDLDPEDDSLRVHACHSPMREMEVLRDQILDAFAADPELRPGDVLVLVPDVATYGPYVEAVFGVEHRGTPKLPFSVADRGAGREQPPAETVLQLLDLVASRVTPGAVFDLLEVAAIRRAASIAEAEVPAVRRWIGDVRVRWGMDGEQRARDFGVPPEEANSWRAGVDRLLMGYAAGDREELVAGVLPHAGATAGDADLLGRLAAFADTLFERLRALGPPRPLGGWAEELHRTLDALYRADGEEEERALLLVRRAIDELAAAGIRTGLAEPVTLEVVRAHLETRLADDTFGSGFITGRITFGALKPMRTIPFRVICVAGLADGVFPRRDPPRSFDLMARQPRLGDRSLADDDRYLFLETVLAAGERLVLTYVGRSQRDSTELPPSVVVSELLDLLDRSFRTPDGRPAREHLRVVHRLQPMSPAYFDGSDRRLFSYSEESYRASAALLGEPRPPAPFVAGAGDVGDDAGDGDGDDAGILELTVRDLEELWINPSRHYCRRVLGLRLDRDDDPDPETEPFDVGGLDRYALHRWLLDRRLRGEEEGGGDGGELELLRAAGELPLAGLGRAAHARLEREVRDFAERIPEHRRQPPEEVELTGDGWRLTGVLDHLTDLGLLHFRPATVKPKDRVRAWVAHVVRGAWEARRDGGERPSLETRVIGRDLELRYPPLEDPTARLQQLIEGYRRGLRHPLPLFEKASFEHARQRRRQADPKKRTRSTPMAKARGGWRGGEKSRGDRQDPYVALCFRGREPLDDDVDDFLACSEELWAPILQAAEEIDR
jgi:exodeoxyribonuclease V gamma subunit